MFYVLKLKNKLIVYSKTDQFALQNILSSNGSWTKPAFPLQCVYQDETKFGKKNISSFLEQLTSKPSPPCFLLYPQINNLYSCRQGTIKRLEVQYAVFTFPTTTWWTRGVSCLRVSLYPDLQIALHKDNKEMTLHSHADEYRSYSVFRIWGGPCLTLR